MSGKKIVLIGCGAVGTSFVYAAINQGIANHYVLIDVNENVAAGNVLDLSDTHAVLPKPFNSIKVGKYEDCADADVIVITAGRPQKPGETRLDMIKDNSLIIKEIGLKVKKSGFKGITLIASNPVDILARVYQEATGFLASKVISSGTTLDSSRLRKLLGEKLGVAPRSVKAYLLGEHGDSSVAIWSRSVVMGKTISEYLEEGKISAQELEEVRNEAANLAYEIIELKRATFYGIGACLTRIVGAILDDSKSTLMVGAFLNGEYGQKDVYISVPCVIGENGIEQVIEWKLETEEIIGIQKSCQKLKEVYESARGVLKK